MARKPSYITQVDSKNLQDVKDILKGLPDFVAEYITSRQTNTSTRTLRQYCYSLRRFFTWMQIAVPHLSDISMKDISLSEMANITARDLEEYMMYLQTDPSSPNSRASISQKISAVSSLLKYLYRHDDIPADPSIKIERPKAEKDNRIVYLNDQEAVSLLDTIEFGVGNIPPHQLHYLERTRCRDLAIVTLMLDTGIRLSECVGLNIDDVILYESKIQVYRKGGKYQYLPINKEVTEILSRYIEERRRVEVPEKADANALFLSMQNRRITGTAIENMIRKYVIFAGITKPITPHKLRKTYGTSLYRKTRDIFMTANALGHNNVNTTSKHYVDDDAESLRQVAEEITVRGRSQNSQT